MKQILILFALTTFAVQSAEIVYTNSGNVKYGMLNRGSGPQAVLFVLATNIEQTLDAAQPYNETGRLLYADNFLIVSLDLPAHGADDIPGQPGGLDGWRYRIEQGIDVATYFANRAKLVLDELITKGYADSGKVYALGTSRGGFMAMQFADQDLRVRGVVGFCPVTRLGTLTEFNSFAGSSNPAAISSMSLVHSASRLSGKRLRLYSGPDDTRVGTVWTVDFVRALNLLSPTQDCILTVKAAVDHNTPSGSYVDVAAWLRTLP
jgi:pimeloyl-ACP methyl ester carboxylesterase